MTEEQQHKIHIICNFINSNEEAIKILKNNKLHDIKYNLGHGECGSFSEYFIGKDTPEDLRSCLISFYQHRNEDLREKITKIIRR